MAASEAARVTLHTTELKGMTEKCMRVELAVTLILYDRTMRGQPALTVYPSPLYIRFSPCSTRVVIVSSQRRRTIHIVLFI